MLIRLYSLYRVSIILCFDHLFDFFIPEESRTSLGGIKRKSSFEKENSEEKNKQTRYLNGNSVPSNVQAALQRRIDTLEAQLLEYQTTWMRKLMFRKSQAIRRSLVKIFSCIMQTKRFELITNTSMNKITYSSTKFRNDSDTIKLLCAVLY